MIGLSTELGTAKIVQTASELPSMTGVRRMYLDVESNSFDKKEGGLYPYLGHRIAGVAVLRDNEPCAHYIPVRHTANKWNLPLDAFRRWLEEAMQVPEWVNHNVKFDAHFCAMDTIKPYRGSMVDTLVLGKLHDSDRWDHGLKALSKDWLGLQMSDADVIEDYLSSIKSKNYGDVPGDILGKYACMDVFSNRKLEHFLQERRPVSVQSTARREIELTPVLFDMEREGMRVDQQKLKVETIRSLMRIIEMSESLAELTRQEFTDSSTHIHEVFSELDLPVLRYTKKGAPSYDAEALKLYTIHPAVRMNEKAERIVMLIIAYRSESHFKSLFLDAFKNLSDENGVLHPDYNQLVRTLRTSCRKPNAQQMNKRAKNLIEPNEGDAFVTADASQVEFRFIVNYANDRAAIAQYQKDPRTDFHQYVADQVGIQRHAGKTLNFAMGFGASRGRAIDMLAGNPDIMAEVSEEINRLIESGELEEKQRSSRYRAMCSERGAKFYTDYHMRFSGIKAITNHAAMLCRSRAMMNHESHVGWIANIYGGRRHLPLKAAHKAFNAVIQGGAMAYIKEKMIALAPRNNSWVRNIGARMFLCVHDQLGWTGPAELMMDPNTREQFRAALEQPPSVSLRIPMIWDVGASAKSLAAASGSESRPETSALPSVGEIPISQETP